MILQYERNVFVDTQLSTSGGQGQLVPIAFPPMPFSIKQGQVQKLTLSSFQMVKNWYNINQSNNTFYDSIAGVITNEYIIPPGDYTMTQLATALASVISAIHAGALVGFTPTTRHFDIDMTATAFPATGFFVFFHDRSGVVPLNVSQGGFFNDSCEVMGAIPSRTGILNGLVDATGAPAVGPVIHHSPYFAHRTTINSLYIRTNRQTNNFAVPSFEKNLPLHTALVNSAIWAKIDIPLETEDEIVSFDDPNGLFSFWLQDNQLSNLNLTIVDAKGRLLPLATSAQASDGMQSWKATIKWSIYTPTPVASPQSLVRAKDPSNMVSLPTTSMASL